MVVQAELAFSTSDLAQVPFAVSPMWEIAPSFRLLKSGTTHPVHRPWADQVRPRMVAAGLDRGWLCELVPPTGGVPDFLNPAPPDRPPPRRQSGTLPGTRVTALRNAGLVSAHRAGRSVLCARTTEAGALLQAASA